MTIRSEFTVHLLNADGIAKAAMLAHIFSVALNGIEEITGSSGREIAIVRTKMEEASFFAKKAMASLPENQKE